MRTVAGKGRVEVTGVTVGVAVVGVATDRAPAGEPPPTGGVQKVSDFLNSGSQYLPENNASPVQQVGDILNVYDENRPTIAAANQLIRRTPAADEHIREFRESLPAAAPQGRMGRPKTMTPAVLEQVCLLLSIGFSRRQAAAYLGISPSSITNAVARDPALGAELRQAEELQTLQPELTIMAEARRNWRAAAWYLNYKAKTPRNTAELTEAEKEEKHQAALADQRRSAELERQSLLSFEANTRAMQEASRAADMRQSPRAR